MTNSQKLALRRSEIRQRLNEISGLEGDALTDEIRAEADTLQTEYRDVETRWRAAVVAEGEQAEERQAEFEAGGNGDGEMAEHRALLRQSSLGGYMVHAAAGTPLDGPEAELNAAAEVRAGPGQGGGVLIPWALLDVPELRDRSPERRADAATTTTQLDGPTAQRPILQRLFGRDIVGALGVRIDTVPSGMSEWPLLTGTAAPASRQEDEALGDATAATFDTQTLKPKRLSARYLYTVEQAAQVADLEQALRRDLTDAVRAKMSDMILNGDPTANGKAGDVTGFYKRLAAPDAPGAVATFADYAGVHATAVDGIHAVREGEVSSVVGVASYQHAASVYQAGSGESGAEALQRRSRSCMASSFVPAAPDSGNGANVQNGNILHAGGDAMRGDSIAAVWPVLEVIRDIYSRADQGGVVLTWITLWDAYVAFRASAYKRVAFKLA